MTHIIEAEALNDLVFHILKAEAPAADRFSTWLVAGYAAAAAVVVANIDNIYQNVDQIFVLYFLGLLMVQIIAAMCAKTLLRSIQMRARGESAVRKARKKIGNMGQVLPGYQFDNVWFSETMARAFLPPYRWIYRAQQKRPYTGVQFAQECLRRNQLQEWCVKVQFLTILLGAGCLFAGALVHQRASTETASHAKLAGQADTARSNRDSWTPNVARSCANRSTVHGAASGCR